jgi:acetyl esterase/lipase
MHPDVSTLPEAAVQVPSQVPHAVYEALVQMGRVVAPPPTEALYVPLSEREPYAGIRVQRDVAYGSDPRHLLDIFEEGVDAGQQLRAKRPVLVFLHGGAFMRGDRRVGNGPFNDNIAVWAARNGCVGVNMTYRLAPANPWPAAQEDIALAIAWLHDHAAQWAGDAKRIVLMGHSAGAAHAAQYLAFPAFHRVPEGGVAAAILLSGLFDPISAEPNLPLQAYFGTDTSLYPARSALPGLVTSKVPLLTAFAELDPEDFCSQSRLLQRCLTQAGKSVAAYQLMGHSHMSEIYSINTPDTALTTLLAEFIAVTNA